MADFYIKRGDTLPLIQATLKNADGSVVNLTGATVKFRMFAVGGAIEKIDAAAVIDDEPNGKVLYAWKPGDTDTAGEFNAEWQVTFANGAIETFPNYDYLKVLVYADLK